MSLMWGDQVQELSVDNGLPLARGLSLSSSEWREKPGTAVEHSVRSELPFNVLLVFCFSA